MPSVWPWRHHLTWYRPINGGGIVRRIKRHTSASEHWIIIYSTVMTDCAVAPALCLRRLASSMGDSNFRPLHRHRRTGWNWFGGGAQACFPDKTGSGAAAAEPVARERRRPYPRNLKKNDCRKRVFQAFQALCSHFEGMGNSKETAGRTGFWSKDEPNRTVITSLWTMIKIYLL